MILGYFLAGTAWEQLGARKFREDVLSFKYTQPLNPYIYKKSVLYLYIYMYIYVYIYVYVYGGAEFPGGRTVFQVTPLLFFITRKPRVE